ncbi:hypothetical protein [Neobacillus sp. PS3-40]|uniref:hypothetical protein n=1 Tax=Neobacillus sp. PS3-40 TaxID=3070679 RepID=UPI0027DFA324|nr:hypothetical protein [Neobacillus sp. PS3-40]WML42848.1 hypothetical protein RCG20_13520 [Neobacillus sp. PS3-40]
MENNLEKGKRTTEDDFEIPDQFDEDLLLWNRGNLPYYELTEAVHEFHMRKL